MAFQSRISFVDIIPRIRSICAYDSVVPIKYGQQNKNKTRIDLRKKNKKKFVKKQKSKTRGKWGNEIVKPITKSSRISFPFKNNAFSLNWIEFPTKNSIISTNSSGFSTKLGNFHTSDRWLLELFLDLLISRTNFQFARLECTDFWLPKLIFNRQIWFWVFETDS